MEYDWIAEVALTQEPEFLLIAAGLNPVHNQTGIEGISFGRSNRTPR
jgi:hypothetical protein